jgi:putative Holliday junction resolvase
MDSLGRILAIDYGMKRVGMAWTDMLRLSINPLPTIAMSDFDTILKEKLSIGEVNEVVFGLPSHKDGTLTSVGEIVVKKTNLLQKKYPNLIVAMIDESFSSVEARQMLILSGVKKKKRQEKGTVDQMSAVLILRDYLNTK